MSLKNKVSSVEWETRVTLAALYRFVALCGWDDLVFTHMTARVPGPEKHFLINGFGTLFEEITASNLVKLDLEGNIILDNGYEVNQAGYLIHSAIHRAREDVGCVIHLHAKAGLAVSALKQGLLPISQKASFILPFLSYHNYEGVVLEEDEQPRLLRDLGKNTYMILRNHGTLTLGPSIPSAFIAMYFLESACDIQMKVLSMGMENVLLDEDILLKAKEMTESHFGVRQEVKMGELAWPAILRKLDKIDPSYKS